MIGKVVEYECCVRANFTTTLPPTQHLEKVLYIVSEVDYGPMWDWDRCSVRWFNKLDKW